jgi:hypothetical protein
VADCEKAAVDFWREGLVVLFKLRSSSCLRQVVDSVREFLREKTCLENAATFVARFAGAERNIGNMGRV